MSFYLEKNMIVSSFFKGAVIGVANIIPGVSGGTMALVLGIYERLIDAIHNINSVTAKSLFNLVLFKESAWSDFKEELKRIDALFLIIIAAGAISAVFALAGIMTMLLKEYHDPTYGFFFGLVLVSAWAPYVLIKRKKAWVVWIAACIAALLVVITAEAVSSGDALIEKAKVKQEQALKKTTGVSPATESHSSSRGPGYFFYFFILGAVAISTMILPGVSGSFLLLLLGGYFDVIRAVHKLDWILIFFIIGCLVGILFFSRFLNFLIKRYHDQTMGFLLGLVAGSLWMIWPFKDSVKIGEEVIFLANRLPSSLSINEGMTLLSTLAGMGVVALLFYIEKRNASSKIEE